MGDNKDKKSKIDKKEAKVKEAKSDKKKGDKKDNNSPVYIMCPRCDINYIDKKDIMCSVCKAETGLIDKSILMPDEEEIGIEKLCPICNINYIGEDEEICFLCAKEKQDKLTAALANEEEWIKEDIEETLPLDGLSVDDDMPISLTALEEDEKFDDEIEDIKSPVDDFDYVDPDEFDDSIIDDIEDEEF